jgi:hypothetical protein
MSTTFEQKRQSVLQQLEVASNQLESTRQAVINRASNRDSKINSLEKAVKKLLGTVNNVDKTFSKEFLSLAKQARDLGANVNASNTNRNSLGYQFGMVRFTLFGPSFKSNHSMPKMSVMDDIINSLKQTVKNRKNRLNTNRAAEAEAKKAANENAAARSQRQANLVRKQKEAKILGQLNKTKSQLNVIRQRADGATVTVNTRTLQRLRQNIENRNVRNFLEQKGYNLSKVENGSVSSEVAARMNKNLVERKKNL